MRETSHLPVRQETMCVYGSFDSQFVHLIKNIDRSKNVLAEGDMIYVFSKFSAPTIAFLAF